VRGWWAAQQHAHLQAEAAKAPGSKLHVLLGQGRQMAFSWV